MIDKNLKAKELYIVYTKKFFINHYKDVSSKALESKG